MPIAVPEKIEPMTPIKTLSAEKKEGTGVEGPAEVKVETNKADGIKVDEVDLKGECPQLLSSRSISHLMVLQMTKRMEPTNYLYRTRPSKTCSIHPTFLSLSKFRSPVVGLKQVSPHS